MNILQINTTDTRGGAARVAYLIKNELEKRGYLTSMFVGRKYSDDENVHLLNDVQSLSGKIRRQLAYYLANDIEVFRSDKLLETKEFKRADIVHCHNLHSYYFNLKTLVKIGRQKPVVWTMHDMWPLTAHCAHSFGGEIKNGFFQCPSKTIFPPIAWHNEKYLENLKRRVYREVNFHIVAPSNWLKDKVSQSVLNDKPISLVYNGVDIDVFKPQIKARARAELGLPPDKKIILSVIKKGQSNTWKGPDYLAAAMAPYRNNQDIAFVNIGSDIPLVKDQTTLAKYYSAADVLLYPSIADNCPLVVLEAQACGLPVVAFRTGGIPEIIEHEKTGYTAEYKDTDDLNYNLCRLINNNEEQIEEIKERSINRVRKMFTLDLMADKYLQLYDRVLSLK